MTNTIDALTFEKTLAPGLKVEARWTNSNRPYRVPATVLRVNKSSLRVTLDEDVVRTEYHYGTGKHENAVIYPKGHEIVLPTFTMGGMARWSQNNRAAPRAS